jgi:hypothetical protein
MSHGMNLQSRTPATELSRAPDGRWIVATPRGDILAKSVVVTTNAYTSSFLPEFKPLIIPVRGTACSITPAPSHLPGSVPGPIKYTYGFRHGPGEVDYMIPRQGRGLVPGQGDRSIILGGAKGCFLHDIDQWYDNINDDVEMPGARAYFEGFMDKYFVGWNGNARGNVDHVWSGGERISDATLTVQCSDTQVISCRTWASTQINRESSSAPVSQVTVRTRCLMRLTSQACLAFLAAPGLSPHSLVPSSTPRKRSQSTRGPHSTRHCQNPTFCPESGSSPRRTASRMPWARAQRQSLMRPRCWPGRWRPSCSVSR